MPLRSASGDRRSRGLKGSRNRRGSTRPAADRVAVGRVLRPHGIRGELKVEVWSDVEGRFDVGSKLLLTVDGRSRAVTIEKARPERGNLLLRLTGIEDRDAAEEVRNAHLEIESSEVPEPPEGFYYHFQLEGCECSDQNTGILGEVVEVVEDGGGILLRVESDGRSVLIPFVDAFLVEVDVEGKQIELRLPEGLITVCTSKS